MTEMVEALWQRASACLNSRHQWFQGKWFDRDCGMLAVCNEESFHNAMADSRIREQGAAKPLGKVFLM